MGSNEEITRVQSWIADWYEVPVESCKFSREDIRDMCRGPMREVLIDFILPRFRTNEQIKVIRNNLYLMDVLNNERDGFQEGGDPQDRKLTELKKRAEEMRKDNVESTKQISKGYRRIMETELDLQRNLLENLAHFKNLDSYVQFLRGRVNATSTLLEDMHHITHSNGLPNNISRSSSFAMESTPMESTPPQLLHLKSLYESTSLLFNQYFIQKSSADSPDVQTLSSSVATQSSELVQFGISPSDVEKWTRREQEKISQQLKNATLKYSNVMNPVETLANEAETLHGKLMKAHVDLHFQNRELQRLSRNLSEQLSEKIKNAIFNDANIAPANLLNLVQKEELQARLIKCRELAPKLKKLDIRSCDEDQELLTLICGEFDNITTESPQMSSTLGADNETSNLSFSRSHNTKQEVNGNTLKQELLEDLTCALLKSCPASKNQLETTIKQCKNLILERFPKLFLRDENSKSDEVANSPGKIKENTTQLLDINIEVPLQFLPNYDILSGSSSVSATSEQNDWLEDILRMQSEVERMRRHNEEIYSKRNINIS